MVAFIPDFNLKTAQKEMRRRFQAQGPRTVRRHEKRDQFVLDVLLSRGVEAARRARRVANRKLR